MRGVVGGIRRPILLLLAAASLALLPTTGAAQATLTGDVPSGPGFGLAVFSGGSIADLEAAAAGRGCSLDAAWATVGGRFVGVIPGAADFVNADFFVQVGATIPADTALTVVCGAEVPAPPPPPVVDLDAFCDTVLMIESDPPFEEFPALADALEASAPAEVADEVALVVGTVREAFETENFELLDDPAFRMADQAIIAHAAAVCGWTAQTVVAVDYLFVGVPSTLAAGTYALQLDNQGTELHEFVLLRRNDDVDVTFQELLELPEEEAIEMVSFAGFAITPPGTQAYGISELTPGDYLMICFIPVGTTSFEDIGEGPPHFVEGMLQEITVE